MIKKYRYKTQEGVILNVESMSMELLRTTLKQMIEASPGTVKLWDEKLMVFIGNARRKKIVNRI